MRVYILAPISESPTLQSRESGKENFEVVIMQRRLPVRKHRADAWPYQLTKVVDMVESTIAADVCVRKHLDEREQIHRHLQVVHSGIQLSVGALRLQNCEVDEDVACMLSHCIGERLLIQIERLAEIVSALEEARTDRNAMEDGDDSAHRQH